MSSFLKEQFKENDVVEAFDGGYWRKGPILEVNLAEVRWRVRCNFSRKEFWTYHVRPSEADDLLTLSHCSDALRQFYHAKTARGKTTGQCSIFPGRKTKYDVSDLSLTLIPNAKLQTFNPQPQTLHPEPQTFRTPGKPLEGARRSWKRLCTASAYKSQAVRRQSCGMARRSGILGDLGVLGLGLRNSGITGVRDERVWGFGVSTFGIRTERCE